MKWYEIIEMAPGVNWYMGILSIVYPIETLATIQHARLPVQSLEVGNEIIIIKLAGHISNALGNLLEGFDNEEHRYYYCGLVSYMCYCPNSISCHIALLFTTIYQAYGPHMAKLYCMERHNCVVDDCFKMLGEDYSLKHIERGRGESNMQHAVSGLETSGLRKLEVIRFMDTALDGFCDD